MLACAGARARCVRAGLKKKSIKRTTLGPHKCEVSALHRAGFLSIFREKSDKKKHFPFFSSFFISNICPFIKQNKNIHLLRVSKLLQFLKSIFFIYRLYRGPFYNRLYTKLFDKRDDFDFHIVNFPFLSSNIPSSPSYGVYISQLIRYARCCSYYDDFGYRHKLLVDRLLSQGYEVKRLRNSFKKFYGRYPDLIGKYQRSVKDMVADSFPD